MELVHFFVSPPVISAQVVLLLHTAVFITTILGHPLQWRNIHMDVNVTKGDQGWQELVLWSNVDAVTESPLLTPFDRDQSNLHVQRDEGTSEVHTEGEQENVPKDENKLKQIAEVVMDSKKSDHMSKIVDKTLESLYIKKLAKNSKTKISCRVCRTAVGVIMMSVRRGNTVEEVVKLALRFCIKLKLETREACEGIMSMFGDRVVYVLQRTLFGAEQICGFLNLCEDVPNQAHEWEVRFPPIEKPDVVELDSVEVRATNSSGLLHMRTSEMRVMLVDQRSFKVLQISDTHLDPDYEEGTNAKCDDFLCCRASDEPAKKPENRAGRWGDYRKCDTPERTLDNMLEHISSTHPDIDYILWTGDLFPHDLWKRKKDSNINILRTTVAQINSRLPGIPIFAALGNHDSWPPYSFPPPFIEQDEYNNSWLYDELEKQWGNWLPVTASKTIRRGAFYSVLLRPDLRIISLNMNFCLRTNWWLFIDSKDPANELQWLIYELQSAEFKSEKVHIIGHIPPGHSDCLKTWSHTYYKIVARYESTIRAQFFGHTHFDEFELFYDPKDLNRPVSVAFMGPSVTPFTGLNPGYKIYYIDGDYGGSTRTVLDHETWVMNLDEANRTNIPVWYKLYSAREAYQLPSLMPDDWHNFVIELDENKELFNTFYRHYWKNSSVKPFCDIQCREDIICDLRSGRSHDRKTLCSKDKKKIYKKPLKKVKRKLKKTLSSCVQGSKLAIEDR